MRLRGLAPTLLVAVLATSTCHDSTPPDQTIPYPLTESVPGYILDADATRILWLDHTLTDTLVKLRVRTTGIDSTVATGFVYGTDVGYLSSVGAVLALVRTGDVHEWHASKLTDLTTGGASTLHVAGQYAIWQSATTLRLRDLIADTTTVVTGSALTSDVAANGDVVYAQQPAGLSRYRIYRYRAGVSTQLTTEPDDTLQDVEPLTDGSHVVFLRTLANGAGGSGGRIIMRDAGGETALAPARASGCSGSLEPVAGRDYQVAGGWVAYITAGADCALALATRAPDGTVRQVTSIAATTTRTASGQVDRVQVGSLTIRALFSDGSVAYAGSDSLGTQHLWTSTAPYDAPKDVGSEKELGTGLGAVVNIDGTLFLVFAGGLFKIS